MTNRIDTIRAALATQEAKELLDELLAETIHLYDLFEDVLYQACAVRQPDGTFKMDDMALSAYERAFSDLGIEDGCTAEAFCNRLNDLRGNLE